MFKSNALLLTSFFIASFSSIAAQTAHERSLSVALTNSTAIVNASAPLLIMEKRAWILQQRLKISSYITIVW